MKERVRTLFLALVLFFAADMIMPLSVHAAQKNAYDLGHLGSTEGSWTTIAGYQFKIKVRSGGSRTYYCRKNSKESGKKLNIGFYNCFLLNGKVYYSDYSYSKDKSTVYCYDIKKNKLKTVLTKKKYIMQVMGVCGDNLYLKYYSDSANPSRHFCRYSLKKKKVLQKWEEKDMLSGDSGHLAHFTEYNNLIYFICNKSRKIVTEIRSGSTFHSILCVYNPSKKNATRISNKKNSVEGSSINGDYLYYTEESNDYCGNVTTRLYRSKLNGKSKKMIKEFTFSNCSSSEVLITGNSIIIYTSSLLEDEGLVLKGFGKIKGDNLNYYVKYNLKTKKISNASWKQWINMHAQNYKIHFVTY